jgi:hypothetical protein
VPSGRERNSPRSARAKLRRASARGEDRRVKPPGEARSLLYPAIHSPGKGSGEIATDLSRGGPQQPLPYPKYRVTHLFPYELSRENGAGCPGDTTEIAAELYPRTGLVRSLAVHRSAVGAPRSRSRFRASIHPRGGGHSSRPRAATRRRTTAAADEARVGAAKNAQKRVMAGPKVPVCRDLLLAQMAITRALPARGLRPDRRNF